MHSPRLCHARSHYSDFCNDREQFWRLPVLQQLQLLSSLSTLAHVLSPVSVRTIAAMCGRVRPGHVLFDVARKFTDYLVHMPSSVASSPAQKKRCVFWADSDSPTSMLPARTPPPHEAPAPHTHIVTCITDQHVETDEWQQRMVSVLTGAACVCGSALLPWSWESEDVEWDMVMPSLVEAIIACLFEAAAVSVRALRAACAGFDGEHAPETVLRDVLLGLAGGGFTRPSMEAVISCCLLPMVCVMRRCLPLPRFKSAAFAGSSS